ncbi:MAG: flagellar hook-basal body complex protein FliE [Candidatus Caenarcaniphilales bacterium]|nr:flagellar hook-basal body complex protein FliE [Candidatus Caenarcaniphilales bacterium]
MYPSFPNLPQLPSIPKVNPIGGQVSHSAADSVLGTFNQFLAEASKDMQTPYDTAKAMMTGKKPFDAAELMLAMTEAERKLNLTVRIVNDLVRGIKTLENTQA